MYSILYKKDKFAVRNITVGYFSIFFIKIWIDFLSLRVQPDLFSTLLKIGLFTFIAMFKDPCSKTYILSVCF